LPAVTGRTQDEVFVVLSGRDEGLYRSGYVLGRKAPGVSDLASIARKTAIAAAAAIAVAAGHFADDTADNETSRACGGTCNQFSPSNCHGFLSLSFSLPGSSLTRTPVSGA